VNEAAHLAARNDEAAVGIEEFDEGAERVTAGLEKRKRGVIHEDERSGSPTTRPPTRWWRSPCPTPTRSTKSRSSRAGLAALGYTMQRPEDDRYLLTQSELESRIQVLLAGTIAEEMVYADVSTGAQNDLERTSEIARAMVMDYGMSRLGR